LRGKRVSADSSRLWHFDAVGLSKSLARFPKALNGGAAPKTALCKFCKPAILETAAGGFYNSLEAPALGEVSNFAELYSGIPARENGALAALMSGSGSTTFAIAGKRGRRRIARGKVQVEVRPEWLAGGGANFAAAGV
jgi:4-diphosphocytidyl-2C-methyl-D-erythritol kinase